MASAQASPKRGSRRAPGGRMKPSAFRRALTAQSPAPFQPARARPLRPGAAMAETTALRPERRGKLMFSVAAMSVALFSRRRLALLGLAIVALSAATLKPAAADTYLSYWENKTSCDFDVKGNDNHFALVPAHGSYDFGPFPWKDPKNVVVVPSVTGCKVTLREARISFAGSFPNKKCHRGDPGPYKFTVDN